MTYQQHVEAACRAYHGDRWDQYLEEARALAREKMTSALTAVVEKHAPVGFDPASDDMTVQFAVKLVEKDAEIERLMDRNEKLASHVLAQKAEIERLRACLGQACRQWRMYADAQKDRDLATEQSVEGVLYRKCVAADVPEQTTGD